jgi:PhoD-like phosphatase
LLRHVGRDHATVWVEADAACEVRVSAPGGPSAADRTFEIAGRHFAIVDLEGLPERASTPYEVALDGARVWPPADEDWDWPASCVRTVGDDHGVRVSFGSCRCSYPNRPPWTLTKDEHPDGRESDALRALALSMRGDDPDNWPHLLLMLGDQIYADEIPPATAQYIATRRDPSVPPGREVADFEEYCRLYHEAWSEPAVRWLLSTVPTAMIFDDHDVHDDWNTSRDWVVAMRARGWWDERIVSAFMSYWCYQHLGNLAPEDRAADDVWGAVRGADGDAGPMLADFAFRADREVEGARWSYRRDIGRTRIIVMDSRAGRVLDPGSRSMVDADEWACIEEWTRGDFDHLLLGTSLPAFLGRGMHHLEAWNEAVCDGAWGKWASRAAEKLRQAVDLEHWAAFGDSLRRLEGLLDEVARGGRGRAPGSIVLLSGDVHHAYLARARWHEGDGRAPVYQAVCSPFRNPLSSHERRAIRIAMSRPAEVVTHALARAAGVVDEPLTWDILTGPWFDNQVATLDLDGRRAVMRIEKVQRDDEAGTRLDQVAEERLA